MCSLELASGIQSSLISGKNPHFSCSIANLTNGYPVPLDLTAIELSMAVAVELSLFMGIGVLLCYQFRFPKWVGPVFVGTYFAVLAITIVADTGAFGTVPK